MYIIQNYYRKTWSKTKIDNIYMEETRARKLSDNATGLLIQEFSVYKSQILLKFG